MTNRRHSEEIVFVSAGNASKAKHEIRRHKRGKKMIGRATHVADMYLRSMPLVRSVMRLDLILLAAVNHKLGKALMKKSLETRPLGNTKS